MKESEKKLIKTCKEFVKKAGGARQGSGRKKRAETVVRGFRVNKEAYEICMAAKSKMRFKVNALIINMAKEIDKSFENK